jgi:PHD/YefM family antitoxin component YafN of YafNO toxin-antitoxin module
MTIPVEEYENMKDEINHLRSLNNTMRAELERRGVIVVPSSTELEGV